MFSEGFYFLNMYIFFFFIFVQNESVELISIIRNQVKLCVCIREKKNVNFESGRGHAKENIKRVCMIVVQLKWFAAIEISLFTSAYIEYSVYLCICMWKNGWLRIALKSSLAILRIIVIIYSKNIWMTEILYLRSLFDLILFKSETGWDTSCMWVYKPYLIWFIQKNRSTCLCVSSFIF